MSRSLAFFLLLSLQWVASPVLLAGEVTRVVPFDFGTVDLHPGGDRIVIAAENGPASPRGGRSLVTGGSSGMVTLTSAEAAHVEILFPEAVTLSSDAQKTLTVRDINAHSQSATGIELPGGGAAVSISIGGVLDLQGNEISGHYSGFMTIQLNFF